MMAHESSLSPGSSLPPPLSGSQSAAVINRIGAPSHRYIVSAMITIIHNVTT